MCTTQIYANSGFRANHFQHYGPRYLWLRKIQEDLEVRLATASLEGMRVGCGISFLCMAVSSSGVVFREAMT